MQLPIRINWSLLRGQSLEISLGSFRLGSSLCCQPSSRRFLCSCSLWFLEHGSCRRLWQGLWSDKPSLLWLWLEVAEDWRLLRSLLALLTRGLTELALGSLSLECHLGAYCGLDDKMRADLASLIVATTLLERGFIYLLNWLFELTEGANNWLHLVLVCHRVLAAVPCYLTSVPILPFAMSILHFAKSLLHLAVSLLHLTR